MARQIVLTYEGADLAFEFAAVDRAKLYGKRRRVPMDRDGQPCTRASLARDGSVLVRSGMTAQGSFDANGVWVPNSELVGLDAEGNPLPKVDSTLGVAVPLSPTTPQDLLDHAITTVYALDGDLPASLRAKLVAGQVIRFPFNYRADWRGESAFLVLAAAPAGAAPGDDGGLFALVGKPTPPVWCGLDTPPPLPEAEAADDDDLDFEMFA